MYQEVRDVLLCLMEENFKFISDTLFLLSQDDILSVQGSVILLFKIDGQLAHGDQINKNNFQVLAKCSLHITRVHILYKGT